jgi:hypothetical protein
MEERQDLPLDAPEADAAEQRREWDDEEPDKDDEKARHVPPDIPEADYLDQAREAGLEEEDRSRG